MRKRAWWCVVGNVCAVVRRRGEGAAAAEGAGNYGIGSGRVGGMLRSGRAREPMCNMDK